LGSWELDNFSFPPGGILIDFERIPIDQAGPRPVDATDTTLGGTPAWERTQIGAEEASWDKSHRIAAEHTAYQYLIIGYFAEAAADESVFQQIANSFRFTD